jgi:GNAT superfamily N-acetyltransferase
MAAANPAVNIRTCQKGDLATVRGFHEAFREETQNGEQELVPLENRLSEYMLLAEVAGELIGYVIGKHQTAEFTHAGSQSTPFHEAEEGYLELQEVYVTPRFRNRGIGSTLVDAALIRARRNGISHSMAYTSNKNWQAGVAFYERCGYRTWCVSMTR